MNLDFPLILVCLTFFSGVIWFFDARFFRVKREKLNRNEPWYVDYARSLFPVFLIVLIIRSFIVQPYRVPSGSLEPTILPNDFIIVNQFAYGLRLPVLDTKILSIGEPKRGDIAVFRYPARPNINYIKRVIGVPGDHVVYHDKQLTINGKLISQKFLKNTVDIEPGGNIPSELREENLNTVKHNILVHKDGSQELIPVDITVPKGMYFMMGDNRDNSGDSRFWGFVPEKNLVGKGEIIWMSWDGKKHRVRWHRIGNRL